MSPIFIVVQIIALYYLIHGIYKSQRRWLSVGYAALGFAVFLLVMLLAVAILGNIFNFDVRAINNTIDGIVLVEFVPSIIGANIPPRRK